jgi:hypothetical protein
MKLLALAPDLLGIAPDNEIDVDRVESALTTLGLDLGDLRTIVQSGDPRLLRALATRLELLEVGRNARAKRDQPCKQQDNSRHEAIREAIASSKKSGH